MNIAVVNESTVVPLTALTAMTTAAHASLRDHVAPAWERRAPQAKTFPGLAAVPAGWDIVAVLDNADQQGALGYHDETPDGRQYGRVFAKTVLDNRGTLTDGSLSVSVTLSHELDELFLDPACDLWADDGGTHEIAVEACDPVENDAYTIGGVAVSNFILPAYLDAQNHVGPWDHMGRLTGPRSMSKGGYLILRTAGAESQKFADVKVDGEYPAWRTASKLAPGSRTLRRITDDEPGG